MGNILHGNRANMSRNPFTSFKKLGKVANKGICVCEREKEECWEILPDQKGLKILWSLSNDNLTALVCEYYHLHMASRHYIDLS